MAELRKDPIIGRWVIISTERSKRDSDWSVSAIQARSSEFCPFCEGNEDRTPPEIFALRGNNSPPNTPGWLIRVVPNKFPALQREGDLSQQQFGVYELINGIGAHEVIIETPQHGLQLADLPVDHIQKLLAIYQQRIHGLTPVQHIKYVLIFKNSGYAAGATLEHSHSQIIATPIIPKRVLEEIEGFKRYYEEKRNCILCDIVRQEMLQKTRIIGQTPLFIALEPFAARFPFESWILPIEHCSHFQEMSAEYLFDFANILKYVLEKLKNRLDNPPYNFILHTNPINTTENMIYHWHLEIIPKLTKVAGFEWGSGFYINPVPPEEAALWLQNS